jgi:hypothetical protein
MCGTPREWELLVQNVKMQKKKKIINVFLNQRKTPKILKGAVIKLQLRETQLPPSLSFSDVLGTGEEFIT